MDKNKKYGNVTIGTLHRIVSILSEAEKLKKELQKDLQHVAEDKKKSIFGANFSWARLYKNSIYRNLLVFLFISGLSGAIKKVKKRNPVNLPEEVLDEFESIKKFRGGPFGIFKEKLMLEYFYPLTKSLDSISLYSTTMDKLLKRATEEDDDKAFFQAVRIDRSVISYKGMTSRIAKAEMEGDEKFFKLLRNALTAKVGDLTEYALLRYILAILHEKKELDTLSEKEAYALLAKELRLYPQTGEDPEGSLWQFISRWKEEVDIDMIK